ncbi:esterase/lipase family protein [Kiloniella litopenaei]|uniref:esterase/lipase family protein n=1 Tax=Kiloniella litopenaei TaxID=1549748 RepID=UPI003BAD7B61
MIDNIEKYLRQGMEFATENLRTGSGAPLNIQMPTLGGKQFWRDEFIYASWRIQFNLYSGHFRLLDPNDKRQAWGSFEDCFAVFEHYKVQKQITPSLHPETDGIHLLVMVHGITRSGDTFQKMKRVFADEGYEVAAITYPSTRAFIHEHADQLARILSRRNDIKTVSFITHSMGGLVVRQLLANLISWKARINIGRLLMVAPPNQGSAIAEWVKQLALYKLIYGKSGQELVPDFVRKIPMPECETAIIAGGKSDGEGYNPFLPGDDDGVVSVAEARLLGCDQVLVLPGLHSSLCNKDTVVDAALNYFRSGRLFANNGEGIKG